MRRKTYSVKLKPETVEKYRRPATDDRPAETDSEVLRRLISLGAHEVDKAWARTGPRWDEGPVF
jgi:hypothetical protein